MKLPNRKLKQWIKALRSGKFNQTREALRRKDNSYCCLGVLCQLNGIEFKTVSVNSGGDADGNHKVYREIKDNLLGETLTDKLTTMNDEGDSFGDIANYLERRVK